eukprot:4141839-Prymnesium_polylepis.2
MLAHGGVQAAGAGTRSTPAFSEGSERLQHLMRVDVQADQAVLGHEGGLVQHAVASSFAPVSLELGPHSAPFPMLAARRSLLSILLQYHHLAVRSATQLHHLLRPTGLGSRMHANAARLTAIPYLRSATEPDATLREETILRQGARIDSRLLVATIGDFTRLQPLAGVLPTA